MLDGGWEQATTPSTSGVPSWVSFPTLVSTWKRSSSAEPYTDAQDWLHLDGTCGNGRRRGLLFQGQGTCARHERVFCTPWGGRTSRSNLRYVAGQGLAPDPPAVP